MKVPACMEPSYTATKGVWEKKQEEKEQHQELKKKGGMERGKRRKERIVGEKEVRQEGGITK